MFREEGGRPNDARGFVHKSFIGRAIGSAVKRFVPAVGIASDIVSTFRKAPARATIPRTQTARPTLAGQRGKALGRELKLGDAVQFQPRLRPVSFPRETALVPLLPVHGGEKGGGPCFPPARRDRRTGECRVFAGEQTGVDPTPVGDAVMGQFGAALVPGNVVIDRAVCLPGMQLAKDGLCYNKGAITNSQRMWPRGRRPLLTGGDMRAIGIAARAGAKLDRTTKRLRALGMMKKLPAPRKAAPHAHAKPLEAVSVHH